MLPPSMLTSTNSMRLEAQRSALLREHHLSAGVPSFFCQPMLFARYVRTCPVHKNQNCNCMCDNTWSTKHMVRNGWCGPSSVCFKSKNVGGCFFNDKPQNELEVEGQKNQKPSEQIKMSKGFTCSIS